MRDPVRRTDLLLNLSRRESSEIPGLEVQLMLQNRVRPSKAKRSGDVALETSAASCDGDADPGGLFAVDSPTPLQRRLGWVAFGNAPLLRRALQWSLIAWLPLVLLCAVEGTLLIPGRNGFATDFAVHSRFLIAVPLLIVAERVCWPQLREIARHFFGRSGLVVCHGNDCVRAIAAVSRLRDSKTARATIVLVAYAIALAIVTSVPETEFPPWQLGELAPPWRFSLAGTWHALVSVPLLMVLLLGWIWRLWTWTYFLWRVSRLDLKLLPSHPDHAAGLRFVSHSVRAQALIAMAFGTIVAGTVANEVVHRGISILQYRTALVALVGLLLALCVGPLLVFTPRIVSAWRKGILEYSELVDAVGHEFEKRWLENREKIDQRALDSPSFSATTDLYSVAANVYDTRVVPVDLASVASLVVATLIPFLPVALAALPFQEMLARLVGLLL